MNDFDKYSKEFYASTENFGLKNVIFSNHIQNSFNLHSMICGYKNAGKYADTTLFDSAESIDYFEYEKELWNLRKTKQ